MGERMVNKSAKRFFSQSEADGLLEVYMNMSSPWQKLAFAKELLEKHDTAYNLGISLLNSNHVRFLGHEIKRIESLLKIKREED